MADFKQEQNPECLCPVDARSEQSPNHPLLYSGACVGQCRGQKNLPSSSRGWSPGCRKRVIQPKLDTGSDAGLPLPPIRKHTKVIRAFCFLLFFFFFFGLRACRQLSCYRPSARQTPSSITSLGKQRPGSQADLISTLSSAIIYLQAEFGCLRLLNGQN